jgi:Fe-S cluster biogenesis protein NfuA
MEDKIKLELEKIRPYVAQHAGDIEFVKFKNGVVYVRMLGMCQGCPLSQVTLKAGVEELLRANIKEVERVEAVA